MRYIPHTEDDIKSMLNTIGIKSIDDLFKTIPLELKLKNDLSLPKPLSEQELILHFNNLKSVNPIIDNIKSFLGAGSYDHFIPSVVKNLASRSEFYTCYTPYQPEISQGTLQAIFEFQSLICMLFNMEVANASMYDGASAIAEAVLMAYRINKKKKVLISTLVHPEYRQVTNTYIRNFDIEIIEIPYSMSGQTELNEIYKKLDSETCAVVIQSPNFFGCIENLGEIRNIIKSSNALFIVAVTEPTSLGILKPPGDFDADIVIGEGQPLGLPMMFGGPYLGLFATKEKFVRTMPGRLAGETVDKEGRRGYVLTLSTREQHIRREKATSNICTNEGLCALTATIYLSTLGKQGFKELAELNFNKAEYAKKEILKIPGFKIPFKSPTFNEFVVKSSRDLEVLQKKLLQNGIVAGLNLSRFYPELKNHLLICITEKKTKTDINELCKALSNA